MFSCFIVKFRLAQMLSLSEVLSEMSFFGKAGIRASRQLQESITSISNQKVTFFKLHVWPIVWGLYNECRVSVYFFANIPYCFDF